MKTPAAWIAGLVLLGVGCGSEPPRIDGVEPLTGLVGEETTLTVRGGGFTFDYDALSDSVTSELSVFVGGEPLTDLEWRGAGELAGDVSPDVPVGRHDVRVVTSSGEVTREEGFIVRPEGVLP